MFKFYTYAINPNNTAAEGQPAKDKIHVPNGSHFLSVKANDENNAIELHAVVPIDVEPDREIEIVMHRDGETPSVPDVVNIFRYVDTVRLRGEVVHVFLNGCPSTVIGRPNETAYRAQRAEDDRDMLAFINHILRG